MDYGFGLMPSEKERSAQRLSLIRRMQGMNSMMAAERETGYRGAMGHSMTSHHAPVEELSHRGIIKVSYDLGYATQTKSLLVEGHTSAKDVVEQLFEQLKLGGTAVDYCLEERNHMSGESRFLKKHECPLSNQMRYGPEATYIELWIVKARDFGNLREIPVGGTKSTRTSAVFNGSDESLEQAGRVASPKEEVSDHGIARLEGVLEEALQDLPSLVHEIQERLRVLSDSVANEDGQPKASLPPRRMLWDQLKPQAAQLVREIRRLVDNCEFLASRHCPSAVCQKIVTLLIELITDHSRELVSITKEMCALRGAASTEFDSSVTSFANQIVIISNLIGKSHSAIRVAAVSAHLLEAIAIDHLQGEQMQISGGVCFTGSKAVSGVLLFAEASAFLGLIRAGYDNKRDYFAKLAANVLRTANWAMNTVRETTEYSLLHLHPLRSRVHDMEQKLKVSMDSLVIAVRKASDHHSSPDAVPEMLLAAHLVIMATLDYLVVAQCASLLHQVFIPEEDVLHMPWVQGVLATKNSTAVGSSSEGQVPSQSSKPGSMHTTSLSSVSTSTDTASSTGTSEAASSHYSPVSKQGNRQSRAGVLSPSKTGADPEVIDEDSGLAINFSKLGMGASRLQLTGEMLSEENPATSSYDEVCQYLSSDVTSPNDVWSSSSGKKKKRPKKQKSRPKLDSDVGDSSLPHKGSSDGGEHEGRADGTHHRLSQMESTSVSEDSEGGGSIEAIQRIRRNYLTNRAIARVAEALHLTVTRKISVLQSMIKEGDRDKCLHEVELVVAAAKQIKEELSVVDMDILVGRRLANNMEKSYPLLEAAVRDVMFASMIAFSNSAPEGTQMKLLATAKVLQDISTKMVGEALKVANEHKKALEQAEELEKEYFGLMTGQKQKYRLGISMESEGSLAKRIQSPARMAVNESEAEKVLFEDRSPETFMPGTKSWSARAAPLVIGGTVKQLVDRLVYTRSLDIEFHQVFLLTFRSFCSPLQLMDALLKRYQMKPPEGLSTSDEEAFEGELAIPTRLRVVSAVRSWIQTSCNDFRSKEMQQKLKTLCDAVDSTMPTCAKQLLALLKENMEEGAVHLRQKPRQQAPPPIVPQEVSLGKDLRITDINSLELSRQLTLTCSQKFRDIRCHDLVLLQNETETSRCITEMQRFSDKLTHWVDETISSQREVDEQVSLLSYFIQTANNCHDLKNFEGLFALMRGLKENCHEGTDGWLSVSSQLVLMYYNLCEVVSADMDHIRYRQELRLVNQSPCVPILSVVLEDVARVARDYPNTIPGAQGAKVINFQKHRMLSHIFSSVMKYQSAPYALLPVETIQAFFSTLPEPQIDQTSVQ